METVNHTRTDARMPGVAGLLVGIVIIVLAILVVSFDLPLPGGNMYGTDGQGAILLAFTGICAMLVGYLETQK